MTTLQYAIWRKTEHNFELVIFYMKQYISTCTCEEIFFNSTAYAFLIINRLELTDQPTNSIYISYQLLKHVDCKCLHSHTYEDAMLSDTQKLACSREGLNAELFLQILTCQSSMKEIRLSRELLLLRHKSA